MPSTQDLLFTRPPDPGDVVMLSVPWDVIDAALAQAGSLDGKIVIDTTNQFSRGGVVDIPGGISAAEYNQRRMPGARRGHAGLYGVRHPDGEKRRRLACE